MGNFGTRVAFIAKTNLNNDGRILNQMKILQDTFNNIIIEFILFPDKPLRIDLGPRVRVRNINTVFRNSGIFRIFTVLEFTAKSLRSFYRIRPDIIHAQDTAIVLPVLLYRLIMGKTVKVIYDDHEIPNENEGFQSKIFNVLENRLMKLADKNIFANEERMEVLIQTLSLKKSKCTFFLNLPYYENGKETTLTESESRLIELNNSIVKGDRFIIHQGSLEYERGRNKLALFTRLLPNGFKIMLLGISKRSFYEFISQYSLDENKFEFVGSVNYLDLPRYWELGVASIVMYLPTFINNRLCAPNRFYLSLQKGLPVIVNTDNPVLFNFVKKYTCGYFIEDFRESSILDVLNELIYIPENIFEDLKKNEIEKLASVYEELGYY